MLTAQQSKTSSDSCACKCCSNGVVAIIVVNVLLWVAVAFSGGALVDCHMVEANIYSKNENEWPVLPTNLVGLTNGQPSDRRGFGFFIHEDDNGNCRWEYWGDNEDTDDSHDWDFSSEDEKEIEDYLEDYVEWMGRDWRKAAKMGISASTIGFVLAIVAGVYACVSHVWWIRWTTGALIISIAAPLQWGTLTVMNSDFCKDRNCELQRSGHFAIVAGILYFLAGLGFFFMKNSPNEKSELASFGTKEQPRTDTVVVLDEGTHQDEEAVYTVDYGYDESEPTTEAETKQNNADKDAGSFQVQVL